MCTCNTARHRPAPLETMIGWFQDTVAYITKSRSSMRWQQITTSFFRVNITNDESACTIPPHLDELANYLSWGCGVHLTMSDSNNTGSHIITVYGTSKWEHPITGRDPTIETARHAEQQVGSDRHWYGCHKCWTNRRNVSTTWLVCWTNWYCQGEVSPTGRLSPMGYIGRSWPRPAKGSISTIFPHGNWIMLLS